MPDQQDDQGGFQQVRQPAPAERVADVADAQPALVPSGPTQLVRGPGGGMRDTLEGMDAYSRHRMVSDMQRRAGNVAVQQMIGQPAAGQNQNVIQPAPPAATRGSASRGAGARPRNRKPEEDREEANQLLLGSLLESSSMGSSGASATRSGPSAASGDDEEGAAVVTLEAPEPPPTFRPGGAADEAPEDRTALSGDALDQLLDRLWRLGVVRGDAALLPGLAVRASGQPGASALRAFALLAALNERLATAALSWPIEDGDGEPAAAALWLAAGAWRAALVDGSMPVAPHELDAAIDAIDAPARVGAVVAWAALARAERAALEGDVIGAAQMLAEAADSADAPLGAAVAAGTRAGLLDAFVDPGVARDRLGAAADRALDLEANADAAYVLARLGLLELLDGQTRAATETLAEAAALPAAELGDQSLIVGLRMLDERGPDQEVTYHLGGLAEEGAANGDYLVVAGTLAVLSRAQRRDPAAGPVGALQTLFSGIALLSRTFGAGTAGPLEYERDALASSLGPDGFKAAMRAAIERSERGLLQRTGPSGPPA